MEMEPDLRAAPVHSSAPAPGTATGSGWRRWAPRLAPRLPIAALFVWALVLFAVGISWGMPSWVGWAGDELHPTSWTQAISPATPMGWHARYPPLHFALLAGLSWPYRALAQRGSAPVDELGLIVHLTYFARLVSLAMALAAVGFLYLAGCEIYGRRKALFAAFAAVSIAPFVYYAKMANLDSPYVCWFTLSLLFYVRILKRHRLRDYLFFAAAAAAAVCTKDQAYGLYTLLPLPIVYGLYRHEFRARGPVAGLARAAVDRRVLGAGLTAAVLFAVFQDILFDRQRFAIHLRLLLGPMSEDYQDFPNTTAGHAELLSLFLKQIAFALNYALAAACVLGLGLAIYRAVARRTGTTEKREALLLLAVFVSVVSYYVTFLNLILFTFDRYVLPVAMVLALFCGYLLGELARPRVPRAKLAAIAGRAVAAAVVVYSALYAASIDFRLLADTRYGVEDYVAAHARRPDSVVGVGRRKHIPRFHWIPWDRAIRSHGRVFENLAPEYVAVNVTDFRHEREQEIYRMLSSGELGYRLVFTRQSKPFLDLLSRQDVDSSQRFVDPEIALFERLADAPAHAAPLPVSAQPPG
ncbi:MAG TPA: glycosyltransferase family 39 protein [Thermoanaerobaculia bacterium]